VRLVAVAILTSLLEARIPALQGRALLLDAVGAVLVLWPFYTALGRIFAWRIALGRAYARERRWAEAERTLRPLARVRYQVFDATGEGAYWLGVALRGLGRNQEAGHLFRSVARQRRGTWQEKAAAEARSLP
jgi:hypothetical protein